MTYRVGDTRKALKQIDRLDKPVVQRIRLFMVRLDRENSRLAGKPLVGDSGLWRYRIGDYRMLVNIKDEELLVFVVDVDHRRQAYRGL